MTAAGLVELAESAAGDDQEAFAVLYRLSAIEVWERLSYYLLMTLLVLFLTAPVAQGGFEWEAPAALGLYGGLVAAMQVLPVFGGALSDRLLGPARALRIGAVLMLAGHFTLAGPHAVPLLVAPGDLADRLGLGTLYAGLALVALGNALFKPNISAIIGRLPFAGNASRDAGFSLFHMFVNIGGLIAIVIGGWVAVRFGYGPAFTMAGFGMVAALVLMRRYRADIKGAIASPAAASAAPSPTLQSQGAAHGWILPASLVLIVVTLFGVTLFQMLGTLNLFAASRVEASLLGMDFPVVWILSMNPVVMLLVMPPLARRWRAGRGPGANLSLSAKAAAGFLFLALAFAGLSLAETLAGDARVPAIALAATIALMTLAELLVGPSALSSITRIVPTRHGALAVGLFYGALGLGGYLSGQIGASAETLGFGDVFMLIASACAATCIVLAALLRATARIGL
ncbi:MAG: peptide MFS transporter [Erythrobacter sp.]